jgi:SAM-dependent methyltransferase
MLKTYSSILENFLNLYWIRPEVAIWRTLDVLLLKSINFQKPIIDLGCGDGSLAFTLFNGKTSSSFDIYRTISSTKGFYDGKDIHTSRNIIKPHIIKKPFKKIQVGLDHKQSLIEKASLLCIYEKVIKHDLEKPLPFANETFRTIFSNVFYWLNNIENILLESYRICKKNGKIILFLPDSEFKKHLIYTLYKKNGYEWAKILDRGIYQNIGKHCYTSNKWKNIFSKFNLSIDTHYNYLSPNLVKLWNVMTRPYSPYVIELSNQVRLSKRDEIKKRVTNELKPLLHSILKNEIKSVGKKNLFHLFVLKKTN